MNREELKEILDKKKIKPGAYNIYGLRKYNPYGLQRILADDQTVLDKEGKKWAVYNYERGQQHDKILFDTEDEACEFLLRQILRDWTSRSI